MTQSNRIWAGLAAACLTLILSCCQAPDDAALRQTPAADAGLDQQASSGAAGNSAPGGGEAEPTPAPGATSPDPQGSTAPGPASPAPSTPAPAPSVPEPAPSAPEPAPFTEQQAQEIALSHAGLSASQVTGLKSEQDWDDGQLEYEIEFWFGSVEYDYTVLAADGTILDSEMENHGGSTSSTGTDYIGEDAARSAALNHAGISGGDASGLRCWMDYDDGRPECYKVEFWAGDTEYEYEIGLYDGCILKHEHETHHQQHHG